MLYRLFAILALLSLLALSTSCSKTTDPECEVLDTAFHGEWDHYLTIQYNPDGSIADETTQILNGNWDIYIDADQMCDVSSCQEICSIESSFDWFDLRTTLEFNDNLHLIISRFMGSGDNEYMLRQNFLEKI